MADELIKNIQMKAVVNEQRINAYPITTIENVNGLSEILNNVPTINDVELALDGTIKLANVGTLSSSKKYALVPGNEAGVYTLSEVIEGSGSGSTPVDPVVADAVWTVFDTPEAVSDFMTEENVGKLVFYTGESFEDIFKDSLYRVIKEENDQEVEYSLDLIYASADRTGDVLADITTDIGQLKNDVIDLQNNSGSNDYYELDNIPIKEMPEVTIDSISVGDNLTSVYMDTSIMPDWSSLVNENNLLRIQFYYFESFNNFCDNYYDCSYYKSKSEPKSANDNDFWYSSRTKKLCQYSASTSQWNEIPVIDLSQYSAIKYLYEDSAKEIYDESRDLFLGIDFSTRKRDIEVVYYTASNGRFNNRASTSKNPSLGQYYYDESNDTIEGYLVDWIATSYEISSDLSNVEHSTPVTAFYKESGNSSNFRCYIYTESNACIYDSTINLSNREGYPTFITSDNDVNYYAWYDAKTQKVYSGFPKWINKDASTYIVNQLRTDTDILYFRSKDSLSVYLNRSGEYSPLMTYPNKEGSILIYNMNYPGVGVFNELILEVGDMDMGILDKDVDYRGMFIPGRTWFIEQGTYDLSYDASQSSTVIHIDPSLSGENSFIKKVNKNLENGKYYMKEGDQPSIEPMEIGTYAPYFNPKMTDDDISLILDSSYEPDVVLSAPGPMAAVGIANDDGTWKYYTSDSDTLYYMESSVTLDYMQSITIFEQDYQPSFNNLMLDAVNTVLYKYNAYTNANTLKVHESSDDYVSTVVDIANYTVSYDSSARPKNPNIGDIFVCTQSDGSGPYITYFSDDDEWEEFENCYFYSASSSEADGVTRSDIAHASFDSSEPTLCYDLSNKVLYTIEEKWTTIQNVKFAEKEPEYLVVSVSEGDPVEVGITNYHYTESQGNCIDEIECQVFDASIEADRTWLYYYNISQEELYLTTPHFTKISYLDSIPEEPEAGTYVYSGGEFIYYMESVVEAEVEPESEDPEEITPEEESEENEESGPVIVPVYLTSQIVFNKYDVSQVGQFYGDGETHTIYVCDQIVYKDIESHTSTPANNTYWVNRETGDIFVYTESADEKDESVIIKKWGVVDHKEVDIELSNWRPYNVDNHTLWYDPKSNMEILQHITEEPSNPTPGVVVLTGVIDVPMYKLFSGIIPEFGNTGVYIMKYEMEYPGYGTMQMIGMGIFRDDISSVQDMFDGESFYIYEKQNMMADGTIVESHGGWDPDSDLIDEKTGKCRIPMIITSINENFVDILGNIVNKKITEASADSIVQCTNNKLIPIGAGDSKEVKIRLEFYNFNEWNNTSSYNPFKKYTYYQINKDELIRYGIDINSDNNYVFELVNDNPLMLGQTGLVLERAESYDDYLQLRFYCIKTDYNGSGSFTIKVTKE